MRVPSFGYADLEKRLAEVVAAAGIADQPVRGPVTGVDVRIDEAGRDELACGIDLAVDPALERRPDVEDLVALEHDLVAPIEAVSPAPVTHHPSTANSRPHRALLRARRARRSRRYGRVASADP